MRLQSFTHIRKRVLILLFFSFSFVPLFSNEIENKLLLDLAKTQSKIKPTAKVSKELHHKLKSIYSKCLIPSKIASDLKKLEYAMKTTRVVLKAVSFVPQLKNSVELALEGIKMIQKPIDKAKDDLDKIDKKLEKISAPMKKLKQFDLLPKLLTGFDKTLTMYKKETKQAQTCIDSVQDTQKKNELQKKLDKISGESDKGLVAINREIVKIEQRFKEIENEAKTYLDPELAILYKIEKTVEALEKKLKNVLNPLHDLERAMKKHFNIKFEFPAPTLKDPLHMKHYHIGFSVKEIIRDMDKLKAKIKHILSKELYKELEKIGIKKKIKELVNKAKKFIKKYESKIKLDFLIKIPGIERIEGVIHKIDIPIRDLPKMLKIDFSALESEIKKIEMNLNSLKTICK